MEAKAHLSHTEEARAVGLDLETRLEKLVMPPWTSDILQ